MVICSFFPDNFLQDTRDDRHHGCDCVFVCGRMEEEVGTLEKALFLQICVEREYNSGFCGCLGIHSNDTVLSVSFFARERYLILFLKPNEVKIIRGESLALLAPSVSNFNSSVIYGNENNN